MDALEDVSIRLAERVAPDEVELAPSIAEAAAQGGKEWDNLIKPFGGAMHGGILPGAEGVETSMPLWTWYALAQISSQASVR
jgi:hypothetical protein